MYLPKHFAETDVDMLHALMCAYPLATVITHTADGPTADHLPLHLSAPCSRLGTLRGHIARANPLGDHDTSLMEVLVIFHGPHAYITPAWYPSKTATGMVVPTWNYVVVHAYGTLRIIDDADWLRTHLTALTTQHEAPLAQPWLLEDAPHDFIQRMLQGVVGIEITITRLTGKWKTSQNQPVANQAGVIAGLQASESPHEKALLQAMLQAQARP